MAARVTGLVIGLAAAAGFALSGLMPEGHAASGARVTMLSLPTGELAVDSEDRFLKASSLEPGAGHDTVRGAIGVTNQTGMPLIVRARVLPSAKNLDDLLRVELRAGARKIFDGRLVELRSWTAESFRLEPADEAQVVVRAWLPASVSSGYEARSADLTLAWQARLAGA